DEFTLKVGDSLRKSIDHGLVKSRYGIVILSPYFFAKEWPQKELAGLTARENTGQKIILPIWHQITGEEIKNYSPILADRIALTTERGLNYVVTELLRVLVDPNKPEAVSNSIPKSIVQNQAIERKKLPAADFTKLAIDPIVAALSSQDKQIRLQAAKTLGKIADPRTIPSLISVLNDDDSRIRKTAADSLVQIGKPAIQALLVALKDQNPRTRSRAAYALGQIGDARTIGDLINAMAESGSSVGRSAELALIKIGKPAVELLINALSSSSSEICGHAIRALGKIGDGRAVEPLIQVFKGRNWINIWTTVQSLGELKDPKAVKPLINVILQYNDEYLKGAALYALRQIGNPSFEFLLSVLKNPDGRQRWLAAMVLGELRDQRVLDELRVVAETDNTQTEWGTVASGANAAIEKILSKSKNS
ncbi:partial putative phycocyanin operon protein Z, partial [Anaerolineae bacterium]